MVLFLFLSSWHHCSLLWWLLRSKGYTSFCTLISICSSIMSILLFWQLPHKLICRVRVCRPAWVCHEVKFHWWFILAILSTELDRYVESWIARCLSVESVMLHTSVWFCTGYVWFADEGDERPHHRLDYSARAVAQSSQQYWVSPFLSLYDSLMWTWLIECILNLSKTTTLSSSELSYWTPRWSVSDQHQSGPELL